MNILLTGGAGYIGSHTAVELLSAGHEVIVVDNLANSSHKVIEHIKGIANRDFSFYQTDILNKSEMNNIFNTHNVDAVIHLAGLKAVAESVANPLEYYHNNVAGSISLFETMRVHGINKLVFSSSATVYGSAPYPYKETTQAGTGITSPYGQTKYMIERIMEDHATSDDRLRYVALRYFNPVGAHESGRIGEDPRDTPNNLMPFIAQTATGKREKLYIFGGDYDTVDGTCVRDFIHVVDLAKGHVAALEHLKAGFDAINLGSGSGTSVMQLLKSFESACKKTLPCEIVDRRPGDLPEFYADASKAEKLLGWKTTKNIHQMCADTWNWQSKNPNGY